MSPVMNGSHQSIGTLATRAEIVEDMIERIREDQRGIFNETVKLDSNCKRLLKMM